ncbi:MAG: DUF6220 domain-containing protein [Marmoricola sp.]
MTTTVSPAPQAPALTGVRRGADVAFGYLAGLFSAAVLAQVFLAGVGAFGSVGGGGPGFDPHEMLGNVLGVFAVVLLVVSLVSRVSWRQWAGALVLAVLTEVAQHGLASAGHNSAWVGGIHAFDGMLILLLSLWLAIASLRRNRA